MTVEDTMALHPFFICLLLFKGLHSFKKKSYNYWFIIFYYNICVLRILHHCPEVFFEGISTRCIIHYWTMLVYSSDMQPIYQMTLVYQQADDQVYVLPQWRMPVAQVIPLINLFCPKDSGDGKTPNMLRLCVWGGGGDGGQYYYNWNWWCTDSLYLLCIFLNAKLC